MMARLRTSDFKQRVMKLPQLCGSLALNAIEQFDKGASSHSGLLGLAHLRRSHHLHGFGDLRRTAD